MSSCNIHDDIIKYAFDGMTDRCQRCQNAGEHYFPVNIVVNNQLHLNLVNICLCNALKISSGFHTPGISAWSDSLDTKSPDQRRNVIVFSLVCGGSIISPSIFTRYKTVY